MSAEQIFIAYDISINALILDKHRRSRIRAFSLAKVSRPTPVTITVRRYSPVCIWRTLLIVVDQTSQATERPGGLPAKLCPFLPRAVNSHANHSYVVLPARAQHNSPRVELLSCCRRYCCGCCWCWSMREEAVNQAQATSKISWSREGRFIISISAIPQKIICFIYRWISLSVIEKSEKNRLDRSVRLNVADSYEKFFFFFLNIIFNQ